MVRTTFTPHGRIALFLRSSSRISLRLSSIHFYPSLPTYLSIYVSTYLYLLVPYIQRLPIFIFTLTALSVPASGFHMLGRSVDMILTPEQQHKAMKACQARLPLSLPLRLPLH